MVDSLSKMFSVKSVVPTLMLGFLFGGPSKMLTNSLKSRKCLLRGKLECELEIFGCKGLTAVFVNRLHIQSYFEVATGLSLEQQKLRETGQKFIKL